MTSKEIDPFHNPSKGIPFALISSFSNALMSTSAKMATLSFSFMVVVFARFALSLFFILLALPFLTRKRSLKELLKINSWKMTLIRIFASIICLTAYYFSLKQIPLSTAVVLVLSSPLYIPLITKLWLKTPILPVLWWPLLIGFVGVLLIVGPELHKAQLSIITAVAAGVFAGISFVAGRQQAKLEKTFAITFWLYLFGALSSLPFFLLERHNFTAYFHAHWALLILVAVFGLLYQLFLIFALRTTRARFVGAFLYSAVIFSLFLDWFFFNMTPHLFNYIGVLLIVMSGILMGFLDQPKKVK